MSILIGGGTGFIGRNLVKHLAKSNYEVIVVTRKPAQKKNHISWEQIQTSGIPKGVEAVVNLSGQSIAVPFAYLLPSTKREWFESRVGTNRILAKAIKEMETPPELFCTMSGVGYYPPSKTAVYDENGPNGSDWMGKLTREWEMAAILPQSMPVRNAVIRSGVVLGADGGIISNIPKYAPPIPMIFGSGEQYFPWIHVTDMVRLIEYVIQNKHMKGVFNGVAPNIVSYKKFALAFSKDRIERGTWKSVIPKNSSFSSFFMKESVVKSIYGKEVSIILLEGQNVDPLRVKKAGFTYQYTTLEEALRNT